MDSEYTTSEIIQQNKTLVYNNLWLLIFIFILILVLFYNDKILIQNQKYLNQVYNNELIIKDKFTNLINTNYTINIINDKMWIVENLLSNQYFNYLKTQFEGKKFNTKNYYYRKATGINFNDLHKTSEYQGFLELYYSEDILRVLTNVLKKHINRPPLSDNNSCSLLIYSNPGDFIDWHLDYSNYYGDRYVVLLSLINYNKDGECCSSNEFIYKDSSNSGEKKLKLKPNNLLIFKGSEILHKSTQIKEGETRILLSMTFCDICQEKQNISYGIYESIKNNILYK
jgi:hypothetical protein